MTSIRKQSASPELATLLSETQALFDKAIRERLSPNAFDGSAGGEPVDAAERLRRAMLYAALSPGKRIRPALVFAACEAFGGAQKDALPAALAVEVLHAYTLVHDDLPCMDDDDERRGKPSVHIQFDEATALLAGDGLLTFAFELLAELPQGGLKAVLTLARACGADGILAGQALDLVVSKKPELAELERIHSAKTGALFAASAKLGGIAAGATDEDLRKLYDFGMQIGVGFQHADDVDDGEFTDLRQQAETRRAELTEKAENWAASLGPSGQLLKAIASWFRG